MQPFAILLQLYARFYEGLCGIDPRNCNQSDSRSAFLVVDESQCAEGEPEEGNEEEAFVQQK